MNVKREEKLGEGFFLDRIPSHFNSLPKLTGNIM